MAPAQHIERHALKGVALANNRYLIGIIVEVVGSLSSGLLTRFHMHLFSRKWDGGLQMVKCWSSFSGFSSKTSWKT
jgi:hypothetical protein